jgi:hypothetical protein
MLVLLMTFTNFIGARECKMTYKVPSDAGDITITRVKPRSVQVPISGTILLTFP